jgi:hypothetical protein
MEKVRNAPAMDNADVMQKLFKVRNILDLAACCEESMAEAYVLQSVCGTVSEMVQELIDGLDHP